MSRLRPVPYRKIKRALEERGYEVARQRRTTCNSGTRTGGLRKSQTMPGKRWGNENHHLDSR